MMTAAYTAPQRDTIVRETFERHDVVCIRDLIAPEWIDALRVAFEEAMAHPKPMNRPKPPGSFVENSLWSRWPAFRARLPWMEAWLVLRRCSSTRSACARSMTRCS